MTQPSAPAPRSVSVQFLKGIGPKKSALLDTLGIHDLLDLFFYVPRRYLDRSTVVSIAALRQIATGGSSEAFAGTPGAEESNYRKDYTVVGNVRSFRVLGVGHKARFVLILADSAGSMQCVWFGGVQYWKRAFRVGETLAVSGQPGLYGSILQFVHPAIDRIAGEGGEDDVDWSKRLNTGGIVPLYPSGQELARVGLDSGGFRRVIGSAIRSHIETIPEILPPVIVKTRKLLPIREAIRRVHFPASVSEVPDALRRMKYQEFFLFQLKLALKRHWLKADSKGIMFSVKSKLARNLVDTLPFALTKAQVRVIKEISQDMEAPAPMNRLLQGDVGSGKTIVALLAMLIAVDNGYQAVFAAPTEILAEQHFATLSSLLKDIPVSIRLLVGAQKARLRRDVLEDVRNGNAQIVVGTHALFEKDVSFARLGFVVIDEQHRFGVLQRASIREKGENPDVLVMTATPIPRTLSLTLYGDLEVSMIDELPANRKPIKTLLRDETDKSSVHEFVRDQVRKGRQAYFVYPLIEESEKVDLKAATVHFDNLQKKVFPDFQVGLLHGRLGVEEKDGVMREFKEGRIDILAATTVVEVGIDVPNATVMVIENAERFGLSQLHQLRGRVGRGSEQSFCILLAARWAGNRSRGRLDPASADLLIDQQHLSDRRLATMVSTNDGFSIAEVDLQLRGPGDFFGTRQSGLPEFRVANILTDTSILNEARADAFELVARDPHLHESDHHLLVAHLRDHFRDELALLRVG